MVKPECQLISIHELREQMKDDPEICILDVREPVEWNEFHIPGAIHIPKDQVIAKINDHMPDKNHPIYVHCLGGVRALYAAHCLIEMGYTEVYSVTGSLKEWDAAGYPIVRP